MGEKPRIIEHWSFSSPTKGQTRWERNVYINQGGVPEACVAKFYNTYTGVQGVLLQVVQRVCLETLLREKLLFTKKTEEPSQTAQKTTNVKKPSQNAHVTTKAEKPSKTAPLTK